MNQKICSFLLLDFEVTTHTFFLFLLFFFKEMAVQTQWIYFAVAKINLTLQSIAYFARQLCSFSCFGCLKTALTQHLKVFRKSTRHFRPTLEMFLYIWDYA